MAETTTRRTAPTPAQLARARKRLEHLEDPAELDWQRAASAALRDHEAEAEAHERQLRQARNRTERRAIGPRPRLRLPALPDFEKGASAAARRTGPIFGRFIVTGASPEHPEGGTIHDVTTATDECRIGRASCRERVYLCV